jgi:uncharacterized protein
VYGLVVIVVGLWLIFYLTCVLPTMWLKVERVKVPLQADLKILQISDMHVEHNRISPRTLQTLITVEQPDIICLTGDFLDLSSSFLLLVPFLQALQSTRIPVYAVLGNHDYNLKKPQTLKILLREYGIVVLENEGVVVKSINLVGIDDFCTGHSDERAFQFVEEGKPVVVMTHDPTITMSMNHSFDYLFSGHLHGKQFAIPFLFKFIDMGPLASSGVYQGLHQCGKGLFYISKGIGQSRINLRFLVRSEVTIHEL